ncbi:MAG TPA: hypothetical protein PKY20_01250 [Methanothrix sp.]|nr:hypothetical protein [Methanothrix sp.]HUM80474.1 hypothetical protein [Methanothrix sp.]
MFRLDTPERMERSFPKLIWIPMIRLWKPQVSYLPTLWIKTREPVGYWFGQNKATETHQSFFHLSLPNSIEHPGCILSNSIQGKVEIEFSFPVILTEAGTPIEASRLAEHLSISVSGDSLIAIPAGDTRHE